MGILTASKQIQFHVFLCIIIIDLIKRTIQLIVTV